ncbi:hypothetical protein ACFQFR_03290 [Streptomyces goshikiensis]
MIPRVHQRGRSTTDALAEALGRPVSSREGLTDHTVVAHWSGLELYILEERTWTVPEWAAHLDDPLHEQPFATSPEGDHRAIFHAEILLHHADRELVQAEWAEVSHRLARAAGIATPGDDHGCRWIAVQAQPGRLDLLANLIRGVGLAGPRPPVPQATERRVPPDRSRPRPPVTHRHSGAWKRH